jgi:hypothetical protein
MSYVLDWLLEASRLLKEARERDGAAASNHKNQTDIWHARVKKLLAPVELSKASE